MSILRRLTPQMAPSAPRSGMTLLAPCMLVLLGSGCAGSAHVHVGSSDRTPREEPSEKPTHGDIPEGEVATRDESTSSSNADVAAEEVPAEPKEAALAREALHRSPGKENHMGLAFTVQQRASDLPWLFTIENRSPETVVLAALPELLELTITTKEGLPPAEQDAKVGTKPASKGSAKEAGPLVCGGKSLPKTLSSEDVIELRPGQLVFHSFDPRDLCPEAEKALIEGASIEARYGFPIETKKLWKGGKLETVEVEQKAPFVAERMNPSAPLVPLKYLASEPFVLGMTYPLSAVAALPADAGSPNGAGSPNSAGPGGKTVASEPPPPPPLTLSIAPLGTSDSPEDGNVTVTVRNTSGKSMQLFLRRELISYEVIGPNGATTCRMYPADRSPDPSAFRRLGTGEATTVNTRLAEACPPGTWEAPGTYSVSARLDAQESGADHELDAFVGTGVTMRPARLVVPGDEDDKRRSMVIVSSRPAP